MGWIDEVKKVQKRDGISYKEALKKASAERKGSKSKTHKGDKDYTTKKGDKDFHEGGHDVKKKRKPYKKTNKKKMKEHKCDCEK